MRQRTAQGRRLARAREPHDRHRDVASKVGVDLALAVIDLDDDGRPERLVRADVPGRIGFDDRRIAADNELTARIGDGAAGKGAWLLGGCGERIAAGLADDHVREEDAAHAWGARHCDRGDRGPGFAEQGCDFSVGVGLADDVERERDRAGVAGIHIALGVEWHACQRGCGGLRQELDGVADVELAADVAGGCVGHKRGRQRVVLSGLADHQVREARHTAAAGDLDVGSGERGAVALAARKAAVEREDDVAVVVRVGIAVTVEHRDLNLWQRLVGPAAHRARQRDLHLVDAQGKRAALEAGGARVVGDGGDQGVCSRLVDVQDLGEIGGSSQRRRRERCSQGMTIGVLEIDSRVGDRVAVCAGEMELHAACESAIDRASARVDLDLDGHFVAGARAGDGRRDLDCSGVWVAAGGLEHVGLLVARANGWVWFIGGRSGDTRRVREVVNWLAAVWGVGRQAPLIFTEPCWT